MRGDEQHERTTAAAVAPSPPPAQSSKQLPPYAPPPTPRNHLQLSNRQQRHTHSVKLPQLLHKLSITQTPPQWPPEISGGGITGSGGGGAGVGGDAEEDGQCFSKWNKTRRQLLERPGDGEGGHRWVTRDT